MVTCGGRLRPDQDTSSPCQTDVREQKTPSALWKFEMTNNFNWSFTAIRGLKITQNLFASTFAIKAVSSTDLSSLDLKFLVRYGYKRLSHHFLAAMP